MPLPSTPSQPWFMIGQSNLKTKPVDSNVPSYDRPENPYTPGSKAYQMYENNPFVSSSTQRTPWETFVNMLGFRSNYDKMETDRINQLKAYDAQIAQIDAEDQYNSPAEQQQRMLEAGLNPQTNPPSGGEGSEFDMASPEFQSMSQYQSQAPNFIQGLFSAIGTALNVVSSVKSGRAQNLSNISSAMDIGKKGAQNVNFGEHDLASLVQKLDSGEDISSLLDDLMFNSRESFYHSINQLPISRKYKKIINRSFDTNFSTDTIGSNIESISDLFDLISNVRTSRRSSPFSVNPYSPENIAGQLFFVSPDSEVNKVLDLISDYTLKSLELDSATRKAIGDFNFSYWKGRSGDNQAKFEEARIKADELIRKGDAMLNECFKDVIEGLYSSSKKSGQNGLVKLFDNTLLLTLFGMRNNMMPSLPLPSFSKDSSEDSRGRKKSSFKFRLGK